MTINVTHDLRITTYPLGWQIDERKKHEKGKDAGKYYWKPYGWYSNRFIDVLDAMYNLMILRNKKTYNLDTVRQEFKEIRETIINAVINEAIKPNNESEEK